MHLRRSLHAFFGCALLAAALVMPGVAHAAVTAPTLTAPASNVSGLVEGGSVTFEWTGTLQGDESARDRAFFRVEVAAADKVPSGTQSEWTELESFLQTETGETVNSASLGVPSAGSYRWRVCAWGVADVADGETIEQLPGGCSSSRAFTTSAASSSSGTIGQITMEEKTQVAGETKTVYVERDEDPTDAAPETDTSETPARTVEEEVFVPATFTKPRARATSSSGSGSGSGGAAAPSSVELGDEGLQLDAAASRSGISGAVTGGLTATLPLVPIPFWTLALMFACLPLARAWRRNVLGMFDPPDIDLELVPKIAPIPHAPPFKDAPDDADVDAPERSRTAA